MKKMFTMILLILTVVVFSQDNYKKGYYINAGGIRIDGFINKSAFIAINDESFKELDFKKDLGQEVIKIDKSLISEFGSDNEVKFKKLKALLDDVSFFKDYEPEKGFSVTEKTVFLNVLVEGNATLYSFDGGNGIKYLWSRIDQGDIVKQFLFKRYYKLNSTLTDNTTFREQLFNNVRCPNQVFNDFLNVKYEKEELISIFKNYNKCTNSSTIIYKQEDEQKALVKCSILAGYSVGNFRVTNILNPTDPEYYNIFSVGLEGEVILPSRKGSIFGSIEIKKGSGSTEKTSTTSELSTTKIRQVFTFDNYFVDFIFGARFYKKISQTSTLFAGGGAGLHAGSGFITLRQSNSIDNELRILSNYTLAGSGFLTLHLGCKINKHWGIDVNYDSPKNLINSAVGTSAKVHEFGVNLRYML